MVTETDLVTQVAEMPCRGTWKFGRDSVTMEKHPGPDELLIYPAGCLCEGTNLQWPTLSRECPGKDLRTLQEEGGADNCDCIGEHSSRVPDVTLEKVLDMLAGEDWSLTFRQVHTSKRLWVHSDEKRLDGQVLFYENTWLEAACAALLQT